MIHHNYAFLHQTVYFVLSELEVAVVVNNKDNNMDDIEETKSLKKDDTEEMNKLPMVS